MFTLICTIVIVWLNRNGNIMTRYIGQSRLMAIVESLANVATGMVLAFSISQLAAYYEGFIQMYIYSGFVWDISPSSNVLMTIVLTVVSVARGYTWRRVFNSIYIKGVK